VWNRRAPIPLTSRHLSSGELKMAYGKLTRREEEIARFVAAGLSNEQIARKANLSEGTVKTHLHRVYQKLGIANRAALAVLIAQTTTATLARRDRGDKVASARYGVTTDGSTHRSV
jgi:DNA-binding NarL/FixJ family response regulator